MRRVGFLLTAEEMAMAAHEQKTAQHIAQKKQFDDHGAGTSFL